MKRFISVVLSITLLLCMFVNTNTSALAAGYSGTCGDGVKWSLNTSSGILSITGSGSMDNYWLNEYAPFYPYRMYIKTVYIYNNVLNIGDNAFSECENLNEIIIGNGVQRIGNCAFSFCNNLKSITIPNTVNEIGYSAFDGCSSLSDVTIGNGVEKIGDSAFRDCLSLTTINIPDSVIKMDGEYYGTFSGCTSLNEIYLGSGLDNIDDYTFWGCTNISTITINPNNKKLKSENNVAFSIDKSKLIKYPNGSDNSYYSIDAGVTELGVHSFSYSDNLKSISIPKTVSKIGYYAFGECNSLSDVYYEGSQEDWNNIAISSGNDSLTKATIHFNSISNIPDENTKIDFGADRFSFGKDITGYVGSEIDTLLVYTSSKGSIATLDISSDNSNVVEIGAIEIGSGDYIASENEQVATVTLKLKSEGSTTITITSPEGISENVNVMVSRVPEVNKTIAVFTTEKSLSVQTGGSMWLAFGLMNTDTGLIEDDWRKMAITVSDPSIISLSDYEKTKYGYSIEVIGKKEGSTNVIITDTTTGISTSMVISVYDSFVQTYSYAINDMNKFYPDNQWEDHIATNVYNLNGLYVNNYQCKEIGDKYSVEFDVYNSKYYAGAIDIYDESGMWLGYEEIEKYSNISSLWDTGEQAFYLISNTVAMIPGGNNSNFLTYEQESFAKHTHISLEIPKGGYFTISNNMGTSPGTFFINSFEVLFDASCTALDVLTSDSAKDSALGEFKRTAAKSFADRLIEARNEGLKDETKKKAQQVMLATMQAEINKITKKFAQAELKDKITITDDMFSEMANLAENILNSYDISWKHTFQTATGIAESLFTQFSGPAGIALKGCFAVTKATDKLLMAAQIAVSTQKPYITVYSEIEEGYINPYGVIVNTNGHMDSEAVLQVFRISNDDAVDAILNDDNPLEKHELYNICFVKDDQLVQPSGMVTVHIPIPEGMNSNTCKVYRQESDGAWTILDAHTEGNYLVFETNHFSLYSIIGNMDDLSVYSVPNRTIYSDGETLDTEGLLLDLNGELISDGFICEPTVLSGTGNIKIAVQYGSAITSFYVRVKPSNGYTISGNVVSYGPQDENCSVDLIDEFGVTEKSESQNGYYTFENIVAGTYTLKVSKENHVTRTYDITVNDENVVKNVKIHLLGDVTGDGKVNTIDVNRVYAHVRETNLLSGYEFECANVAGTDAYVNITDVNRIYAHVKGTNLLW